MSQYFSYFWKYCGRAELRHYVGQLCLEDLERDNNKFGEEY